MIISCEAISRPPNHQADPVPGAQQLTDQPSGRATALQACHVACPSSGKRIIIPISPVATQTPKSMRTMNPRRSRRDRLFHTSFMLVPMAVSASTRPSQHGIAKTLMANANAANMPRSRFQR